MHLYQAVLTALEMIRAHKLRSFFTILGTVVGVTFLIAVITLISGIDAYVTEEFARQLYGVNSVIVRRTPAIQLEVGRETRRAWQRRRNLTFADAEWLSERMETPGVISVSSRTGGQIQGPDGTRADNVQIVGASASYFRTRTMDLAAGRVFHEQEDERGLPLAVIGMDVAENLFPGTTPIGKEIRIRDFPYQVIGVLERQGSLFGMSLDNLVIAPARSPLNGYVSPWNVAEEITFRAADARYLSAAIVEMEGWLRVRRRLMPGEPNDFELETADASLSFWTEISQVLYLALPGLVGISLVVGAVVIMNIMLVSVTQRTSEIGLRKSLGARKRDIMRQFVVEAATLSGLGGLMGIALGMALAGVVAELSPLPARVAPWSVALGLVLGVGVGIAAGAYPAYRAAKLDPIEALRHE